MISEDRLRNWGRFVRLGRFRKGHCMSIEHRAEPTYNPPQAAQIEWLYAHGHVSELERIKMYADIPKARAPMVDAADADLIEAGWRYMTVSRYKDALKRKYVKKWANRMLASKFRVTDIEGFMLLAVANLAESVKKSATRPETGMYSMQNSVPHSVSYLRLAA